MNLTRIRNSFIAGLCGTAVHSLLVLVHSKTGPLPEFQPNDDFQRALSWLTGTDIHPGVAWLLLFVNGAVIWGFVFGQVYRFLPGKGPRQKGVFFGVCAWIVMWFVFFPLVDRGIFARSPNGGLLVVGSSLAASLAGETKSTYRVHSKFRSEDAKKR